MINISLKDNSIAPIIQFYISIEESLYGTFLHIHIWNMVDLNILKNNDFSFLIPPKNKQNLIILKEIKHKLSILELLSCSNFVLC